MECRLTELARNAVPPGVRAVLFDAVGTLIRPQPSAAEAYYALGKHFGSKLELDEVARRFKDVFARFERDETSPWSYLAKTDEDVEKLRWQRIVSHVFNDVKSIEPLFQGLWGHFATPDNWALCDGAAETWLALEGHDFLLGVASNFDARLHAVLDGLPPLDRCKLRFVSSEIGHRKPHAEFFRAVERRLDLRPDQLLLVGDDRRNDYEGALAAGWHARHLTQP